MARLISDAGRGQCVRYEDGNRLNLRADNLTIERGFVKQRIALLSDPAYRSSQPVSNPARASRRGFCLPGEHHQMNEVLNRREAADFLRVSTRQFDRLKLPRTYLGSPASSKATSPASSAATSLPRLSVHTVRPVLSRARVASGATGSDRD